MPGNINAVGKTVKSISDKPGLSAQTTEFRNLTVACDPAFRNFADGLPDAVVTTSMKWSICHEAQAVPDTRRSLRVSETYNRPYVQGFLPQRPTHDLVSKDQLLSLQ
jgi:hypothetical protein